jgi:hypothetical protein
MLPLVLLHVRSLSGTSHRTASTPLPLFRFILSLIHISYICWLWMWHLCVTRVFENKGFGLFRSKKEDITRKRRKSREELKTICISSLALQPCLRLSLLHGFIRIHFYALESSAPPRRTRYYTSFGRYPLPCLAWVAPPGGHTPAGVALRVTERADKAIMR